MSFDFMKPVASLWGHDDAAAAPAAAPASEVTPAAPPLGAAPIGGASGTTNAGFTGPATANMASAGLFDWLLGNDEKVPVLKPVLGDVAKQMQVAVDKMIAEQKAKQEAKAQRDKEVEEDAQKDPLFKKDPKAARELADARRDLKSKFEIVDAKSPEKDRKQNQVTEEEFKKMTKVYAGIKNDENDLKIETKTGDAKKDEDLKGKELEDIARIMQTKSGRGLISNLADNKDKTGRHHVTTIHALADENAMPKTVPNKDEKSKNGENDPIVNLSPGAIVKIPGTSDKVDWANINRSDVVLYHELVHAYHYSKNDNATWNMHSKDPGVDAMDDNVDASEYEAVGLGPWAKGGKYEKGFNKQKDGTPVGAADYTENKYREERNNITDSGQYNAEIPQYYKDKYPGWEKQWKDGKLAQRDRYNPEPNISN